MSERNRKPIRGKGWKKTPTIAQEKFDAVSRAILKVLTAKGMRWGVLADRVQARLPRFPGSVPWYTISVLRELETQGKVRRELGPPVLYSKRGRR
jgi:hypothetical protein